MAIEQCNELETLRQSLILNETLQNANERTVINETRRHELVTSGIVLEKIEDVFTDLLTSIVHEKSPKLKYAKREWNNVRYDINKGVILRAETTQVKCKFNAIKSIKNFALTLDILSKIYVLLQSNGFSTKREIYYQNPQLFHSQKTVDTIIDNISCLLQVPRRCLHIMATSKGLIAGNLQFIDVHYNYFDCTLNKSGVSIPADVDGITNLHSNAEFVLIIEKDATFQKVLDENNNLPPHILVTGKGYPDVNTRQMVKKLWDALHIPILALGDADPHGIEIMFVYRFGSLSSSYDSESLAVPYIRWLGILPSDIGRLQIPESSLMPLNEGDKSKLKSLLKRPYCRLAHSPVAKSLTHQLKLLQDSEVKAEIQSLYSFSPTFLCSVYIPTKIRLGGWI